MFTIKPDVILEYAWTNVEVIVTSTCIYDIDE